MRSALILLTLGLLLAGCGGSDTSSDADKASASSVTDASNPYEPGTLEWAAAGPWRLNPERDVWRHPLDTLRFFEVQPDEKVVEIWPGDGWYTSLLAPYLKAGGGSLTVAVFDPEGAPPAVQAARDSFTRRFADTNTFGTLTEAPFGPNAKPPGPANSADVVLTFRNVHNWMAQGWAEKAFADMYAVLKPGGTLGVVEHRANADAPQDPLARSGYVQEAYVIELAQAAGFEFVAKSEINANPRDTKDHPFGVWTLPPTLRTAAPGAAPPAGFDPTRYTAIGESDRMTLRFRKPGAAPATPVDSASPAASAPAPAS